ncbi:MAG: hypothetical protein EP343_10045 [Deltaproteobacteria bacterium]|nr:MAG: hypothetical protein EP343_10045 [Deltaproteobacteria bacterium]
MPTLVREIDQRFADKNKKDKTMPSAQPEKKEALLEMLSNSMVMLHLDATHPEAEVPAHFREDSQLRLNVSYRFANVNLDVDDHYIYAVLSFNQTPFSCKIPLESIWGATQHSTQEFRLFPDNIPTELREQLALYASLLSEQDNHKVESPQEEPEASEEPTPSRPALRVVDDSFLEEEEEASEIAPEEDIAPEPAPTPKPSRPDRSMFRVISNPEKN